MLETAPTLHGNRSGDRAARRLSVRFEDPITTGRALLLVTGLLTFAGAPAMHLNTQAWLVLATVSAVMLCVVVASMYVKGKHLPAPALLVFPILVFLAFTALSLGQHGMFAPLSGFFTLCYGYAGLTQRPRRSLLLIPASSLALVCVYGGFSDQVIVRLVVATSVWVILAEVLASFTARHERMAQALQRAAFNDALTGLPNRRDLDKQFTLVRPGTSVIVCDLDHFKQLNDTLGHSVGDHVLSNFGSTVRGVLREGDYCARYGGEEFVILLPDTTPADTDRVLSRLRQRWALMQPNVTFSAGAAQCRTDRTPTVTLVAADHALYAAKAAGRNTTRHDQPYHSGTVDTAEVQLLRD